MKKLLPLLIFLLCGWPSANMGVNVAAVGGGGGFTDCATDGASMDYCQDFEEPGGGNPGGEVPAMSADFNDTNCDYTPAIDGSESCERGVSGRITDQSAFTAISGQSWWQFLLNTPATPTDFNLVFSSMNSTSNVYPRVLYSSASGSNYKMTLFCDGSFSMGTNDETTSTFTTTTDYLVKMEFNTTDGTGSLYVCAYGTDPFDSCAGTAEATCDGADGATSQDGWMVENSNLIIDDVFVSTTDLSP